MRLLKQLGKRFLLCSTSVLAVLLLMEVALRLYDLKSGCFSGRFYPYTARQFFLEDLSARVPHPSWHHGLAPDYVSDHYLIHPDTGRPIACRINKDGFRDKEFEYHPDEFRVFFLGDSFTDGYYLDQEHAIPQQTEAVLRMTGVNDGRVRTFNFGCGSYSPLLCYRILRHYMDRFRPNMVIYVMNWGDAFDDAYFGYASCFECDADGLPLRMKKQAHRARVLASHPGLKINSYLFLATTELLNRIRGTRPAGHVGDDSGDPADWRTIRATQLWYAIQPTAKQEVLREIYTEAFKPIAGMRQLCQAAGADFRVVYIPSPWEISSQETPSSREPGADDFRRRLTPLMEEKGCYESLSESVLVEVAQEHGVELHLPLAALRERARFERLHWVSDCHMNKAGAAFYADICAAIVTERAQSQTARAANLE